MTRVVDYAWARPSMATIRAQGAPGDPVVGVIRYLSLQPSKNLSAAEYATLRGAGFQVGLVWETAADIALGGHNQGVRDAQRANAQADDLRYPRTAAIYYAVDFDAPKSALPVILAYLDGVRDVGVRPCGVYGSYAVVEACSRAADYLWQTSAWSAGKVSGHAHLYQHIYRQDLDVNTVRITAWGQDSGGTTQPPPEDSMSAAEVADLKQYVRQSLAGIVDDIARATGAAVHTQQLFRSEKPDGSPLTIADVLLGEYREVPLTGGQVRAYVDEILARLPAASATEIRGQLQTIAGRVRVQLPDTTPAAGAADPE